MCLSKEHEEITLQATGDLESTLIGHFNLPEALCPTGLRLALNKRRAQEKNLQLAHKLWAEIGKVSVRPLCVCCMAEAKTNNSV